MTKRLYASLIAIMALVFGALSGVAPAHADVIVGGGTGGGGGGAGGGGGNLRWHYYGPNLANLNSPLPGIWSGDAVYGDPASSGIPNSGGYNAPNGPSYVASAMRQLQADCNRTDVIAVYGQVNVGSNWQQFSWWAGPTYWNEQISYATLASRGGSEAAKSQLLALGNAPIGQKTVVCVTDGKPDRPWEIPSYTPATDTISVTCVYSRSVGIKRQISDGLGRDPIGEDNLEDQPSVDLITPFGNLLNTYNNATTKPTPATAKTNLDAACAQSQPAVSARPKVDLSDNNKAGLAEGGVLNVTEFSRFATYTASQSYEKLNGCYSGMERWDSATNTWYQISSTFGPCTGSYPDTRNTQASTGTFALGSANNTGFWQMLSVHCNKEEFDALLASVNGETVEATNDGTGGVFSAMVYSKNYATVPTRLDFGDTLNPSPAAAKSGLVSFYDKECPFDCTPDKTGAGASAANGATTNTGNDKPDPTGTVDKYGAVSDRNNTNKFEFFRDNKPYPIKLDVWYPKTQGVVSYDGSAPLTTTVNRWGGGTPSIDGSSGGKFEMKTDTGQSVFNTSGSVLNQRDWDPTTDTPDSAYLYSSPTSAMLKGLVRDFTVQSTWASDTDKPQVLNVKWEYAPTVSTSFSTTGLGISSTDTAARDSATTQTANVQGKCYAQFGTTTGLNTTTMFQQNTGTGVMNNLDGKLVQGDTTGKPADDSSNLFINFVRATTE